MTDAIAIAIHGHDIIDLVSQYPDGIRLSQLMEVVDERFGQSDTFWHRIQVECDFRALARKRKQLIAGIQPANSITSAA